MNPSNGAEGNDQGTPASPLPRPAGRNGNAGGGADGDVERYAKPDVSADREGPAGEAGAPEASQPSKTPALEIKQIEDLEDDAMGG